MGRDGEVPAHTRLLALQVAAVLTLPFDVVKTQRQIELGDSEVHPGEGPGCGWMPGGNEDSLVVCGHPWTLTRSPLPTGTASKPSSTWLLMRRIHAESGTRGLFAGKAVPPRPGWGLLVPGVTKGLTGLSLQASCPESLRWHPPAPS